MATKRRSSKEILAIIEAAIQKASDEGRDFADTSLDMPGEEVSPLTGYGVEADEIFAEANIRSGTQLGQFIAELKRLAPDQLPITGTTEVSGDITPSRPSVDPTVTPIAEDVEEEVDPSLQRAFAAYPEIDRAADEEVDAEIEQGVPDAKPTVTVPEEAAVDAGPKETLAGLLGAGRQQGPPKPPGDLGPGKAEAILGILEVLGGLGGKIAQGRAMRRADKKTEQSQRVANLINALSRGRAGAQATTAQPRMGTGGQVLSALGGVGRMGGRLVDAQKKAKAAEYERELAAYRAETARGRLGPSVNPSAQKGLSTYDVTSDQKGFVELVATFIEPGSIDPESEAMRLASQNKSFTSLTPDEQDAVINGIVRAHGRLSIAGDKGAVDLIGKVNRVIATQVKNVDRALPDHTLSAYAKADVADGSSDKSWSYGGVRDQVLSILRPVFESAGKYFTDAGGSRAGQALLASGAQNSLIAEGQRVLNAYNTERIAHLSKKREDLAAREQAEWEANKPTPRQKELLAEAETLESEIAGFQKRYDDLELKGPIVSGLGEISQYLTPDNFVYSDLSEAFALKIAAILNKGRPSNVDFEAARRMIPLASDSNEVAQAKFENLRRVTKYARLALQRGIYLPLHLRARKAPKDAYFNITQEEIDRVQGDGGGLGGAIFLQDEDVQYLLKEARDGDKWAQKMLNDNFASAVAINQVKGVQIETTDTWYRASPDEAPESEALSKEDEAKVREYMAQNNVSRKEAEKHVLKKW